MLRFQTLTRAFQKKEMITGLIKVQRILYLSNMYGIVLFEAVISGWLCEKEVNLQFLGQT